MEKLIDAIQAGCKCDRASAQDLLNAEVQRIQNAGESDTLMKSKLVGKACDRLHISRNPYQFKILVLFNDGAFN